MGAVVAPPIEPCEQIESLLLNIRTSPRKEHHE